jgi:predicted O-methyltransferase YrrM
MYSLPQLAFKYLRYYITASNGKGHGTHSPFLFDFITTVLNDKAGYSEYKKVEALRKQLLSDSRMFVIEDFGAGTAFLEKHKRSIQSIARNAAKSKKYGQLLFRMIRKYKPATIIELGTSLGITTSYLSLASPAAKVITMEGAAEIATVARQNFSKLALKNIDLIQGNFDNTLPTVVNNLPVADFVFIDGNHRRLPTERYFETLLPKSNNDSVFIFDDIHWSKEMENAWAAIKNHPDVKATIDLFFLGIVFLKKEFLEKQHFTIRF